MKILSIEKSFVSIWRTNNTLREYKISSTRMPQQTIQNLSNAFPYAHIEAVPQTGSRKFDSGSQLSTYIVTLTWYGGPVSQVNTSLASSIADAMDDAYSFNLGFPLVDRCFVLSILPLSELPVLDGDDYYGSDIRNVTMQWKIQLSEYREAIRQS